MGLTDEQSAAQFDEWAATEEGQRLIARRAEIEARLAEREARRAARKAEGFE